MITISLQETIKITLQEQVSLTTLLYDITAHMFLAGTLHAHCFLPTPHMFPSILSKESRVFAKKKCLEKNKEKIITKSSWPCSASGTQQLSS